MRSRSRRPRRRGTGLSQAGLDPGLGADGPEHNVRQLNQDVIALETSGLFRGLRAVIRGVDLRDRRTAPRFGGYRAVWSASEIIRKDTDSRQAVPCRASDWFAQF